MRKIFLTYLVLVHSLLLIVLAKSDFVDRVKMKFGINHSSYEFTKFYHEMISYHERMDGNIPKNSTIFIGDSITQSLAVSAIKTNSVNFGIGSDTSLGVLERIKKYQSINTANIIVVAIGINDLKFREPDEVLVNYIKIIKSIPITTKIIFSSVLPVNENFLLNSNINNKNISYLNLKLEGICSLYSNVYFLNVSKLLTDKFLNLSNTYHVGDGVHLNKEGYDIWIRSLNRKINSINTNSTY
ncbi:MAG: GDSL family lipase [Desulfobacteraceae bacterium]|nr:GDSL family lipase [Desulfobacteraceae bacterium]